MSEDRLNRLEDALIKLTEKFTEFVKIESGRQERDKHQVGINEKLLKHIEKFEDEYKPTIRRSAKHHKWLDFFFGKVILSSVILAILSAAGYKFM